MILFLLFSFSFSDLIDDMGDLWSNLNKAQGPTGFEVLQFDMDAMVNSMGGNYWDKGVHALMSNPSEIIKDEDPSGINPSFVFTHRALSCGMVTEFMGYVFPKWGGFWGVALEGFFSGDMELRDERPGEALGTYSAENLIIGLTYARRFDDFSIGGTYRYLHERIFNEAYSTYSFDLGISRSYTFMDDKIVRMDIAFLHLGPKFYDDEARLPTTWHLGLKTKIGSFRGGGSVDKPLNTEIQYSIGGEYRMEWLSIRAGKKFKNPLEKYSFGIGLRKESFSLDYSFSPTDNGYEGSHLFTASIGL